MAITKVTSGGITDSAITSAKINDGAITNDDINSSAALATSKITGLATSATTDTTDASNITSGTIPTARLSSTLDLSSKTVTLPAASVTAHVTQTDTTTIENNIAMLGFYRAADNSKAVFNMIDSVVDTFTDATGIDAGNSTQEYTTGGYYRGRVTTSGDATGGTVTQSGGYTYHAFLHTGGLNAQTSATFTTPSTGTIDYLIVGGGGSGQSSHAGGRSAGSGGNYSLSTGQSKTAANYTIVTGGGGQGYTSKNNGQSSSAFGSTQTGGVWGYNTSGAGHAGVTISQFSQFGVSGVFRGGGGYVCYAGGSGGGGRGGCAVDDNPPAATANTGGGGGSGNTHYNASGSGGSGVVLIRYLTNSFTSYGVGDLTLQSTATTAEATPTTGDIVMLLEDAAGTATLNTDIKGYVSRDGGTTWTQGTLTDEGDWGTNKKVLAFHNLDISGQPSGTSMKYKVTTHNQSASKETRVHATSLAWA